MEHCLELQRQIEGVTNVIIQILEDLDRRPLDQESVRRLVARLDACVSALNYLLGSLLENFPMNPCIFLLQTQPMYGLCSLIEFCLNRLNQDGYYRKIPDGLRQDIISLRNCVSLLEKHQANLIAPAPPNVGDYFHTIVHAPDNADAHYAYEILRDRVQVLNDKAERRVYLHRCERALRELVEHCRNYQNRVSTCHRSDLLGRIWRQCIPPVHATPRLIAEISSNHPDDPTVEEILRCFIGEAP